MTTKYGPGSAWRGRGALASAASLALSSGVALTPMGCGGQAEQTHSHGAGGSGGSRQVAGAGGMAAVAPAGTGGTGPYMQGPHGGANQPCYPSASCDPGFRCTSAFTCALDPSVAGAFGQGGTFGGVSGQGPESAGSAATGGAPPPIVPFCSAKAFPPQLRVPLPFTVTQTFIPSGWQGNPAAISYGDCSFMDRVPGAVGSCAYWAYTPSLLPDEWVGVAYVRMWDLYYTHPPVCLADGVAFVEFYAKGESGGETVVFSAQGSVELAFTLTTDWQLYRIPMAGVTYNTDASGVELGFFWKLIPTLVGDPIAKTSFEVDGIRWVGADGSGGAGGASSDAGASGEGSVEQAGSGGS